MVLNQFSIIVHSSKLVGVAYEFWYHYHKNHDYIKKLQQCFLHYLKLDQIRSDILFNTIL